MQHCQDSAEIDRRYSMLLEFPAARKQRYLPLRMAQLYIKLAKACEESV